MITILCFYVTYLVVNLPLLRFLWRCSVRVSNELGAGNPKAAKFSITVNVLTSAVIGLIISATILATRKEFPRLFTNEQHVIKETSKLGYILAAIIFLNGIQPVLLGISL